MYKTANGPLAKGDILWLKGFKFLRSIGPKQTCYSPSPFMVLEEPVIADDYEAIRGFWFVSAPGKPIPTEEFLESPEWLKIPKGEEPAASAIAAALWGPVDEDWVLFEGPRKYSPRTMYGFSYDREVVVYRALSAYFSPLSYRELLVRARGFCFDKSTWPEALGIYLRGDEPLREYITHHLNEEVLHWLRELSQESWEIFSLEVPDAENGDT